MAILQTIPTWLKKAISKTQRPLRIRSPEEDKILDEQEENLRKSNYDNFISRAESSCNKIFNQAQMNIFLNILPKLEESRSDEEKFADYLKQLGASCESIVNTASGLSDEIRCAKEFIHPSYSAIIRVVNDFNKVLVVN